MVLTRRSMILGAAAWGARPALAEGMHVMGGLAFGSAWRIVSSVDLRRVRSRLDAIFAAVDSEMSPYRAGSALSRFNRASSGVWHEVPVAFCHVTRAALRISDATEGAFDPTVGPLVARQGFGPIEGDAVSVSGLQVRPGALRKSVPGLTVDLCGIAKGYALDRVIDVLTGAQVRDALVEVGGEVRTLGAVPTGRPWQVAIADPHSDTFGAHRIIAPRGRALATSGHSANGLNGSVQTSHIINPTNGAPAATALSSVSVLADTALIADALATALCAAGPRLGVTLARRLGVSALFVTDGLRHPPETMTGTFAHHVLI